MLIPESRLSIGLQTKEYQTITKSPTHAVKLLSNFQKKKTWIKLMHISKVKIPFHWQTISYSSRARHVIWYASKTTMTRSSMFLLFSIYFWAVKPIVRLLITAGQMRNVNTGHIRRLGHDTYRCKRIYMCINSAQGRALEMSQILCSVKLTACGFGGPSVYFWYTVYRASVLSKLPIINNNNAKARIEMHGNF